MPASPDKPDKLVFAVNLSGGRSSAYMLHHLLERHGGALPPNWVTVYCNTGKEREETLEFVRRIGESWGVDVHWLEYRHRPQAAGGAKDPRHVAVRVDHASASRRGEPFQALMRAKNLIPHDTFRLCTAELKIETQRRYLRRELGATHVISLIGLRFDEPRRWMKRKEDAAVEMPLVAARRTAADVQAFWRAHPFDLGIPSWKGNCDLCFLKSKANLVATIREEPWRADWWLAAEAWRRDATYGAGAKARAENAQMSQSRSFADLVRLAREGDLFEGFGEVGDEPAIDCFCGESA